MRKSIAYFVSKQLIVECAVAIQLLSSCLIVGLLLLKRCYSKWTRVTRLQQVACYLDVPGDMDGSILEVTR
ncbi:hypothetical protein AKJ16_DCAP03563 [Drosera capensis]